MGIRGKGSNPNSHGNRPLVNGEGTEKMTVTVTPSQMKAIARIGNGNRSEGIRILTEMKQDEFFRRSPLFSQIKFLLQELAEEPQKAVELHHRILEVADKMESVEIDEAYDD